MIFQPWRIVLAALFAIAAGIAANAAAHAKDLYSAISMVITAIACIILITLVLSKKTNGGSK